MDVFMKQLFQTLRCIDSHISESALARRLEILQYSMNRSVSTGSVKLSVFFKVLGLIGYTWKPGKTVGPPFPSTPAIIRLITGRAVESPHMKTAVKASPAFTAVFIFSFNPRGFYSISRKDPGLPALFSLLLSYSQQAAGPPWGCCSNPGGSARRNRAFFL